MATPISVATGHSMSSSPRLHWLYLRRMVIASVVVGGTSLNGGRGSLLGTLVGALLIAVINNGMNLLGITPFAQKVVLGFVILVAVLLDRLRQNPR